VKDLKIMMVGPRDFVSDKVRSAWRAAGAELLGPFAISQVDATKAIKANGVVIDISQDPDAVFLLSERLDVLRIPFLYALDEKTAMGSVTPFVVNSVRADIVAITTALLTEGDTGTRH
jgi:hypothetical protein